MGFFDGLGEMLLETATEKAIRKEELIKRRSDLLHLIGEYNREAEVLGVELIEYGIYSENETPDPVKPTAEPTAEQKKEAAIKAADGVGFKYSYEAEEYITKVLGGSKIGFMKYTVGYHVLSIEEERKEGSIHSENVIHVLS